MKKLALLLIFILTLSASTGAFSASYSDQAYQYDIDIPEGENIYYYTPQLSNMPEDILSASQEKTPPINFMAVAYEETKTFAYSIDIAVLPLTEALNDPSIAGINDFSSLTEVQSTKLSQDKIAEYGADYVFDANSTESLSGKTALVLTGRLAEPDGLTRKLYLLVDSDQLFTITVLFRDDAANLYFNQVSSVIRTLRFASTPFVENQVSMAPTTMPTSTPTHVPSVVISSEPTTAGNIPENSFFEFVGKIGATISNAYYNNPYFPLYVASGCIVVALIVIIIILIRINRRKDNQGKIASPEEVFHSTHKKNADNLTESTDVSSLSEEPLKESQITSANSSSLSRPTLVEQALIQTIPEIEESKISPDESSVQNIKPSDTSIDTDRPKIGSRMDRHRKK